MGQMKIIIFVFCFLVEHASPLAVCHENQLVHGVLQSLGLDDLTMPAFGFSIVVLYYAYSIFFPKKKDAKTEREPSLKNFESKSSDAAKDATPETNQNVLYEHPVHHSTGHALFKKSGVEVIAADSSTTTDESAVHVPRDLVLQATSDSEMPGLLEEDELPLSPGIKLMSSVSKLSSQLEVWIPHGANMILTGQNWNVILKEYKNNRWVTISQSKKSTGQGIKDFVCKSNHVRFKTDHLSQFKVVGTFDKSTSSVFKRMKVAVFCSNTRVGEDLDMRLYCFDDCEWSFERLKETEKKKGGKLISSIESLNFSVTSEEDVKIAIKDVAGWQLYKASPMISYKSLRNSFNIIPHCDMVFHPSSKSIISRFFVVVALTQGTTAETIMYATTSLEKRSLGNSGKDVVGLKTAETQEDSNICVVNL